MRLTPESSMLLHDPIDHQPLEYAPDALVNPAAGRRYPIVEGIPVLLNPADLGPQNRKIQKMYRWMSRGFDVVDRLGNLFTGNAINNLRRLLAQRLPLIPGCRCLYTSIGTGLDIPFLAERLSLEQFQLVGLDLSMEMLVQCRRKLPDRARSCFLVQANAECLPFPAGTFDIVLHVGGINLFDRPAQAVREMMRVAKPGALVLYADETPAVVRRQYQGWNPFTRRACRGISTDFEPRQWIPAGAQQVAYETVWGGRGYFITFRVPESRGADSHGNRRPAASFPSASAATATLDI